MIKRTPIPSQEILNDLFIYDNGKLFWKIKPCKNVYIGDEAGTYCERGYRRVTLNHKRYLLHRVIFKMFHNTEPDYIDHIDGNTTNNKIENLQELTHKENCQKKNWQYCSQVQCFIQTGTGCLDLIMGR